MSNKIIFLNPSTKQLRSSPIGFSWTTAGFWFMPALFRGDWKWALVQLILMPITLCWSQVAFMFIYNKLYIRDLLNNGFYPVMNEDAKKLVAFKVCTIEEIRMYKEIYESNTNESENT